MDKLIKKLSNGKHRVVLEPRTQSLTEIRERLSRGFVFIKFVETKGETELGITVDVTKTQVSDADFESGTGTLRLVGACELNFLKVCCRAEIDLSSRRGEGALEL